MRIRGIGGLLLGAAIGLIVVPAALADGISFISQDRSVNAVAGVALGGSQDFDQNTASAPDFNVFDAFVSADAALPAGTASSSASQRSEILPFEIRGSGEVTGSVLDNDLGGLETLTADSSLLVNFVVKSTVNFVIDVMLMSDGTPGFGEFAGGLRLTGPGGDVVDYVFSGVKSSVSAVGELTPGEYTLEAGAVFVALNAPSNQLAEFNATYDFQVVLPEPTTAMLIGMGLLAFRRKRRSLRSAS